MGVTPKSKPLSVSLKGRGRLGELLTNTKQDFLLKDLNNNKVSIFFLHIFTYVKNNFHPSVNSHHNYLQT